METQNIYEDDGPAFTRIFSTDIVEKVNPIEFYKTHELQIRATLLRDLLETEDPILSSQLNDSFFEKKAEESLVGFFEEKEQTPIHENFTKLLQTTRKKDQENLLKGMSLNLEQLISLIFKSYKDFNFLYSRYRFENLPNGVEDKELPILIKIVDDKIKKVGTTGLTDGKLKNVIVHRKVIISHFFEKGDVWHCFFITYNSIAGKENHNDGQPHFHYISSGFGITKEDFIESMRTGNYKSTPIHIDLLNYGNQPEKNNNR